MQAHRIAVALAAIVLAAPATAGAHTLRGLEHAGRAARSHDVRHHHHHHHLRVRHAAQVTAPESTSNATTSPASTTPVVVPASATYVEADDQHCTAADVVPFLQAHEATILRMVIAPWMVTAGAGLPCIEAARDASYHIYLSVRYDAGAPTSQTVAYFRRVLRTYGPLWAVSVGNEEGITSDINTASPTVAQYLETWNLVEPVIAGAGAQPIVGESDPWQGDWLMQVMAAKPVGAAAASFHCYAEAQQGGLGQVPEISAAASADGLPLWCSEMAPAINASQTPFFEQQTLGQYDADVTQTLAQSPDVQLRSWYEWDGIGATTPNIAP